MKVSFLGLGRMGRELVQHVIGGGHEVIVWNRTESATANAAAAGARVAGSAAEAVADAEVVITMFFGPDVVREVLIEPGAAFAAGALWVDATTVGPDDATAFGQWAAGRGVRFVSAPVVGTVGPAHDGTLGTLLGGDAADVAAAREVTDLWSDPEKVREFATPAQAITAKLIANLGVAVVAEGIAEALRLGHAGGMSTDEVLAVLPVTQLAAQATVKGATIARRSWEDSVQFSVDALVKDTGFMTALAGGGSLPALEAFAAALAAAHDDGLGGADYVAALREDA